MKFNLAGRKFGRLTVIKDSGKRVEKSRIVWTCICDCGNLKEVDTKRLTTGRTKSCACLRKELMSINWKTHGDSKCRLYRIWIHMKRRCCNSKRDKDKFYRDRKIKVCAEWRSNYMAFRNWTLSHGYQKDLCIDRINHRGNYEPSNCQWLSASE